VDDLTQVGLGFPRPPLVLFELWPVDPIFWFFHLFWNCSLVFYIVGFEVRKSMGSGDNKEFQQVLHRHEEIIEDNNSDLLVISSKIYDLEGAYSTNNVSGISIMLLQK